MTDWLILVENPADLGQGETPHKVMRVDDYLARPALFAERRPYVLNLARSYTYQSEGYYASLLAEARGHRVSPTVQTMVELSRKQLYAKALPDLEASLNEAIKRGAPPLDRLFVALSRTSYPAYERLAREVADWFRTPALEVRLSKDKPQRIERIRPLSLHRMAADDRAFFIDALADFTRKTVREPKSRPPARWSLAILIDPNEKTPPSKPSDIRRLIEVAARKGVAAEIIGPNDLPSLAEFDALFIRATTNIDNFTYRFARRAEQEGMPVMDDTQSIIRSSNKVYQKETFEREGIALPPTEVINEQSDLAAVIERLGTPIVLKTPDGAFGLDMVKAGTLAELESASKKLFKRTALLIAQAFVPTQFDWRIGILDGEPLFACQYHMAKGHWQIISHEKDGRTRGGGFATMPVSEAPPDAIALAVNAARLIGSGLYGVDIKQTDRGLFVMEVNDNANLEHAVEGAVLKDALWSAVVQWFSNRLESRLVG